MGYRVEIRGLKDWGGRPVNRQEWIPAIAGTLNQSGCDAESASTFDTYDGAEEARRMVWDMLAEEAGEASPRGGAHLRIIEV